MVLDGSANVFDLARDHKLIDCGAINEWHNACIDNPHILNATLDLALAHALKIDEIQTRLFSLEIPVVTDNCERLELALGHLIAGLKLQSSTFYFAEGLVDDFAGWESNPIKQITDNPTVIGQGKVDVLAQIGPALLQRHIKSGELVWNQDLSWRNLRKAAGELLDRGDERSKLIGELMRLTGVSAERILFAFEFMEFIPVRVGGKKADMTEEEAKTVFSNLKDGANTGVAGFNALIKFLSWLPNDEEDEPNPGLSRTYSSVRNPVEMVKEFIFSSTHLWRCSEDMHTFQQQIQAMGMPAAEGRAILFLLEKGVIKIDGIDLQQLAQRSEDIIDHVQKEADSITLCDQGNPVLIGGKGKGLVTLKEVARFFPEFGIPDFVVMDTITVDKILESFGVTFNEVFSLNLRDDEELVKGIKAKIETGEISDEITQQIFCRFKGKNIAVRSSSVIEDGDSQTIGAGAFESILDVNTSELGGIKKALKDVLLSNFSERAIALRKRTGLPFMPSQLAIVLQEMVQGDAGVVFAQDNKVTISLGCGPDSVTSGTSSLIELDEARNEKLQRIISILMQTFGINLDIEFVVDAKTEEIKIVQLRKLIQSNDTNITRETIEFPIIKIKTIRGIRSTLTEAVTIDLSELDITTNSGEIMTFLARNKNVRGIIARASTTSHLASIARQFGISFTQTL